MNRSRNASIGQTGVHLPMNWPWETGLDELFRRALHDPPARTAGWTRPAAASAA
ncbi:hypothetical protein [Pseudonocardia charpentierae]|uniref:Uncharacterized protein n=1 Tax=Pseudonocardia charpentierae TaxID=3075545 RepID=A0ABU2NI33_9PSEU|nr:hypothetical protein [Pseudonocardia sp. DSM 45834]MDT0353628.1 hypothetical protein [Pseudonocardia sp. DSM 45834]